MFLTGIFCFAAEESQGQGTFDVVVTVDERFKTITSLKIFNISTGASVHKYPEYIEPMNQTIPFGEIFSVLFIFFAAVIIATGSAGVFIAVIGKNLPFNFVQVVIFRSGLRFGVFLSIIRVLIVVQGRGSADSFVVVHNYAPSTLFDPPSSLASTAGVYSKQLSIPVEEKYKPTDHISIRASPIQINSRQRSETPRKWKQRQEPKPRGRPR
uniref:Uncharacterized protein n=1 Tax=Romanomermis culicivorax TaxID=13658 RepID=A0A915IPU8_ROMCU